MRRILIGLFALVLMGCNAGEVAQTTSTVEVTTTSMFSTTTTQATTTTTVELTDEDLFLASVLDKGYTIDGRPMENLVESDLFEFGELWCDLLDSALPNLDVERWEEFKTISYQSMFGDESSDNIEAKLAMLIGAEHFLCPEYK